jgi:signal transduction histidine kinase/ligand-binding sensor domain-containing protein
LVLFNAVPLMARSPYPSVRFLFCAFILTGGLIAGAFAAESRAPKNYTLREWHEADGLPSDDLAGVVQDGQGFLWVAMTNELARFDGTAFERFAVPFELYARGLTRIEGRPVVPATRAAATPQAGFAVLHDGTWRFEPEDRLAGKLPRSVFGGPEGSLWLGCEDGTVLQRQGENVTVFEPPVEAAGKKAPAFATDSNKTVWVVRGNRLNRVDASGWNEISLPSTEPELRIASSRTGGIWVLTRTALLRWNGSALEEILRLPELAGAHFVQTAQEDSHGYLWIGTRSQGLFRIANRTIEPVPTSSEDVTAVCEDTDGNIWAVTNGAGLSRLRPKAHQLFDQSSGLKDNFSFTVAEDNAGTMWLANRDGGMARIKDGVVDPISRRAGWRAFSTMSVFPSASGRVWITTGLGVYRTSADTPQLAVRVPSLANLRNVRATFVASNGDYWLAADPDRVARWRDDQVTLFGPETGFDAREVRAFAEDASKNIWVGAADGRLFREQGERFERVTFPSAAECGALQVLRFENDGSLLLGTTRHGIIIFPAGDLSRPRSLDNSRGLPGNNISQILLDDFDRYWFASRTGVFWVHGREIRDFAAGKIQHVHAILLGKDDGLPDLSCLGLFQPAAWKAHDGTLWFATRRGVLRTDPAVMASASEVPPPVTITSIVVDGRTLPFEPEVSLQSSVRKIQLRLSALNLSAPESVQVRFRLDGFDSDWVVLGKDRLVTYPRLPAGHYVFSTTASNGSGSWNSQPVQLTIVVRPPWWQSPVPSFVALALLIAVVIASVRKWSHRRLRLRLERAEHARAIEHERARIARNIHDDVGASLTRISLLTQVAQQESPTHSPSLEKIYAATHAITRSMDEIVWAVNPRHDNTESLVYYLGNFAQSLLGAAGIRCRLESPEHMPAAALTSQIRHHLFLCCKEALHNVVKHAHATEAAVRIWTENRSLAISISDNGRGISPNGDVPSGPARATSGNGLRNMRERMADIGGTCTIATDANGTKLTFVVPLEIIAHPA